MNTSIALLLIVATGASAARAPVHPTPSASQAVAGMHRAPQVPLQAHWKVTSDDGSTLRIRAIVTTAIALAAPISVHVEIPSGLTLVSGETSFQIPSGSPAGETTREFQFAYAVKPAANLRLVAHVRGRKFGAHATDVYRFGRPKPQAPQPMRSGPDIKIGNVNLGPAVQLDKSK